jgi:hypothetical protein
MNAADLPPELAQPATTGLMTWCAPSPRGRWPAGPTPSTSGAYPADLLQQLAAAGAMSAHLDKADGTPGDYGSPSWPWPRPPRSAAPPAS